MRNVTLAWLIPQAQFGLFGVAVLVINILLPLCSVGIYEGATRYAPFHEANRSLRSFVGRTVGILTGLTLASGVIFWLFAEPCSGILFSAARLSGDTQATSGDDSQLVQLFRMTVLCVVALAALHTMLGFFKGLHMFRAFGAAEVVSALIFTTLAIGGAWAGFASAEALVLAYLLACVACVAIFAPGWVAQLARSHPERSKSQPAHGGALPSAEGESPKSAGRLMSYSFWAAATAVSWHFMAYYPMWYLLKMTDGETVGAYHAVRLIAQVIQLGAAILTGVVAANVTRIWEHQDRDEATKRLTLLTKAALLVFLVAASVFLVARPLVLRIFPPSFSEGDAAYQPLVLTFLLVGVVGLLAVRLNVLEKPRLVCLAWCVGTIVTVIASSILIQPVSDSAKSELVPIAAAAWASALGVTAALVTCLVLVWYQGLGMERRVVMLVAACFSIGLGIAYALPVLVLVLVLLFATRVVFSVEEARDLRSAILPRCSNRPKTQTSDTSPDA